MRIAVIGGGTGSFTVLRGLKKHDCDISAIVSMFDNGGSTGILRDEFGVLPPGDVRRCLIALAPEDDNVLRSLFMYRFDEHSSLHGHSFGNLFLTALTKVAGSEADAILQASKVLRISGKVLPVSLDNCQLSAELEDGTVVRGETKIDIPRHDAKLRISRLYLEPEATANPETIDAIRSADLVIIGPGDLYTSVLPNLLVKGISEALLATKAKKVYVCNLMTKYGETTGYRASEHLSEVIRYGGHPDMIVCNSAQGNPELLLRYASQNQYPVVVDSDAIGRMGVKLVLADVMSAPELIRHDSEKLATLLLGITG